ncbi:hypothetical protein OBV_10510 [Oscillibacter valericigenes Sjm18-20]|nr:hypothetical protein OBV_10510 [Oscillibacter valericigenes Sjm18-20]
MKNTTVLTVLSAAGGGLAFLLRLVQKRTGFSPDTGLPIPGDLPARLLLILLVFLCAALFLMVRRLPSRHPDPRPFQDVFSVQGAVTPLVGGITLLVLSGAAQVWSVLSGSPDFSSDGPLPSAVVLISGVLTALSALCLLPAVLSASAGHRSRNRLAAPPTLLLFTPAALVFQLVLDYRTRSANPVPEAYALELLALGFAALAFFHLASFAFGDGSAQVFSFLAGGTVILCAVALADGLGFAADAFYGGCILFFPGLLCSLQPDAGRQRGSVSGEESL